MVIAVAERHLKLREEASYSRYCQRHAAEFPQKLVPFLGGDSVPSLDGLDDGVKSVLSVRGE